MKPNSSCQSTGVPTRHGSVSKCAPCVESVIRTNGETSRFTPSTEDIAAQTSERLARTGNSTISRIRPDCPLRRHFATAHRRQAMSPDGRADRQKCVRYARPVVNLLFEPAVDSEGD